MVEAMIEAAPKVAEAANVVVEQAPNTPGVEIAGEATEEPAPSRPERHLRRPKVKEVTGLSDSTLYRMIAAGKFPRPKRIGERAVGWPESEIAKWLASRQAA